MITVRVRVHRVSRNRNRNRNRNTRTRGAIKQKIEAWGGLAIVSFYSRSRDNESFLVIQLRADILDIPSIFSKATPRRTIVRGAHRAIN